MKVLFFAILLAGCWPQKDEGEVNVPVKPPGPSRIILNIDNGSLENIDSYNASQFWVRGNCSREGAIVRVTADNFRPKKWAKCFDGNFHSVLDLSPLNKEEVEILVTHERKTIRATVKNSFICPENYISAAQLRTYSRKDFCVARFEAKNDGNGKAISTHAGLPWTNLTMEEQISACKENGEGYDLISNDQWQVVARNIESVSKNWGGGIIGSVQGINTGVSDLDKNHGPLAGSEDFSDTCFGTGSICTQDVWHKDKRTHILSNGEIIWDFSGNVMERLKDRNHTDYATFPINERPTISNVTDESYTVMGCMSGGPARLAKGHFGPAGIYSHLKKVPFGGLGIADFTDAPNGISRGGHWYKGIETGIFSVSTNEGVDSTRDTLGFRCVFLP